MNIIKTKISKSHIIFILVLLAIFVFRFPSLYEPFWYGDEGIFAAVANNLNQGGVLYQTAWDNKPPMIYLTYAVIFKFLGVSMFSLRVVALIVVLATAATIYEIVVKVSTVKRALVATGTFGFLVSLRLIEGNLALTEIFMILPITLAMLIVIIRKFDYPSLLSAGVLIAIGSLYKQVGVLEAAALGIYLFITTKKFSVFFKMGLILSLGFAIPYAIAVGYFASKKLLADYIFAAYTYYRIYLGESPQYAGLVNSLKFVPLVSAISWSIYLKRKGKVTVVNLFFLWAAFSFLGSFFSGRTYGHYLVQVVPALAIVVSLIARPAKIRREFILFMIAFLAPVIILVKVLFADFISGSPLNITGDWQNFVAFSTKNRSVDDYNNYFDYNVNRIMALGDFFNSRDKRGVSAYIWGDFPWLYAIADLKNPSRYVTSFHVFGVPNGRKEVIDALIANPPEYIIKPESSIGYFAQLEEFLGARYTFISEIENSRVYAKIQ